MTGWPAKIMTGCYLNFNSAVQCMLVPRKRQPYFEWLHYSASSVPLSPHIESTSHAVRGGPTGSKGHK